MTLTADIIRERFPGRVALNPEEVAAVIHGNTDRATVQGIREGLTRGTIIPGLRKRGGRWLVPIGPLVAALDRTEDLQRLPDIARTGRHTVVVSGPISSKPRRGRLPDAVRLARAMEWGAAVIHSLGVLEQIDRANAAKADEEILGDRTPLGAEGRRPPL